MLGPALLKRAGYDLTSRMNTDLVGRLYIAAAVIWTVIVCSGLIALHRLRHLTCIRMRNNTLSAAAVLVIHVYLFLVLLLYVLNDRYPCAFEYWIMSTYFPIGVALFQAQNIHLVELSIQQRQLIEKPPGEVATAAPTRSGLAGYFDRWRRLSLVRRTYHVIGVCMVVQIAVAFVIFLISRKFLPTGVVSKSGSSVQCRMGWEWLPSALWQVIWTYGYGPWVLYKLRGIRDVHHWKFQTALAIVFNLPGLPLVIAAIYSSGFTRINPSWPPPMWFAPGLIVMQVCAVFMPLFEALRSRHQYLVTIAALEDWEDARRKAAAFSGDSLKKSSSISHAEKQERRDLYGMEALERALTQNCAALKQFAAGKEFTVENINFLEAVGIWKKKWADARAHTGIVSLEAQRNLYGEATDIFKRDVWRGTQYPINIEGKHYAELDRLLGKTMPEEQSDATPWERGDVEVGVVTADLSNVAIPRGFDENIFDAAEASVKYMVLTNTWVRFVDASEGSTLRSSTQPSSKEVSSRPSTRRSSLWSWRRRS